MKFPEGAEIDHDEDDDDEDDDEEEEDDEDDEEDEEESERFLFFFGCTCFLGLGTFGIAETMIFFDLLRGFSSDVRAEVALSVDIELLEALKICFDSFSSNSRFFIFFSFFRM